MTGMPTNSERFLSSVFDITDKMRDCATEAQSSASDIIASLTMRQQRVIKAVKIITVERPEGIPLKELAEKLNLSAATTSELVESLVKKDILNRNQCPDDRRAVRITLSAECKNIIVVGTKTLDAITSNIFTNISTEELATTLNTLEFIREKVLAIEEKNYDNK